MKKLHRNFYPLKLNVINLKLGRRKRRLARKNTDSSPLLRKGRRKRIESIEIIKAPEEIGLHNPGLHYNLTTFLRRLRNAVSARKHNSIVIDFKETKTFGAAGTILLLAEIDRLSSISFAPKLSCYYPVNETAEKVMQQVGLIKLLNRAERKTITESDKSVYHWHYITGQDVNAVGLGPMFIDLRNKLPTQATRDIFDGVSEAMVNSVQHAYAEPRNDVLCKIGHTDQKKWWFFGEVLDGHLHVVFCDLGIGIPRSLPRNWHEYCFDAMLLRKSSRFDLAIIKKAMMLGRTRTEQSHRGLGLHKDIIGAAKKLKGQLLIYSNKAVVGLNYTDQANSKKVQDRFKRSILGTVICWTIPVNDTQGEEL